MANRRRRYGYPCRKHRLWFKGSYCPACYKERRDAEKSR